MNEIVKDAFELCEPAFQGKCNDMSKRKIKGKSKGKSTETSLSSLFQSLDTIDCKALHYFWFNWIHWFNYLVELMYFLAVNPSYN